MMRKQTGKAASFMLAALLAACSLVGCGTSGTTTTTAAGTTAAGTTEAETTAAVTTEAATTTAAMTTAAATTAVSMTIAAESETAAAAVTTAAAAAGSETLADGTYVADFTTDSKMFHTNEANEGKCLLTVKDGKMTAHVSLASENIVNLFSGSSEDAQKAGAELIQPTTDTVKYSDGTTEEVYGFDIPVPAVGQPFPVALIGTKGKWYDHEVTIENPEAGDTVPGAVADSQS